MVSGESEELGVNQSLHYKTRELMEEIVEKTVAKQMDLLRESALSQIESMRAFLSTLQKLTQFAMFKTYVQSGGRISIPETERKTVNIEEGDLVQVIIFPIKINRKREKAGEKNE